MAMLFGLSSCTNGAPSCIASSASNTPGSGSQSTSIKIDGFLGDIGIDGSHRGDFLADVAGFADGKNVLVGEERAPRSFDRVFGGDDGAHAGKFFRFARIDMADARVRVGAAQNFSDQHAGKINVGDVLRVAGDFVEAFDPLNAFADDGKFFCFSHNCVLYDFRFSHRSKYESNFRHKLAFPHALSGNPGQIF